MRLEERPPTYVTVSFRLIDTVNFVSTHCHIVPHGKSLSTNQSQRPLVNRKRLPVATYEPRGEFLNSVGGDNGVGRFWL
jgi:hypothetical protein